MGHVIGFGSAYGNGDTLMAIGAFRRHSLECAVFHGNHMAQLLSNNLNRNQPSFMLAAKTVEK